MHANTHRWTSGTKCSNPTPRSSPPKKRKLLHSSLDHVLVEAQRINGAKIEKSRIKHGGSLLPASRSPIVGRTSDRPSWRRAPPSTAVRPACSTSTSSRRRSPPRDAPPTRTCTGRRGPCCAHYGRVTVGAPQEVGLAERMRRLAEERAHARVHRDRVADDEDRAYSTHVYSSPTLTTLVMVLALEHLDRLDDALVRAIRSRRLCWRCVQRAARTVTRRATVTHMYASSTGMPCARSSSPDIHCGMRSKKACVSRRPPSTRIGGSARACTGYGSRGYCSLLNEPPPRAAE